MRFSVVLFDLDGTVIDSGAIILASLRYATREVLGEAPADEVLMAGVGGPALEARMVDFGGPERAAELTRVYRAHNEALHHEIELFPGMEELLVELRAQGRRTGLVSAKRRVTVELALRSTATEALFDVIVGGDETMRHKPAPEPLLLALARLHAPASDAVYVGDSPFDMGSAKAAGVAAIGVSWGGIHGREALDDADLIVDTVEQLRAAL